MAKVDVLIPTYNPKRGHLTEALASLQAQANTEWQALIHDDCSPNGETEDIVKPFLSDSRIRFERSPMRLGIGGNWNACLQKTSAPLVAYLFQDDLWHPDYLSAAISGLESHASAGFISLEHEYRGEGGMTNLPLYQNIRDFRKKNVSPGMHKGIDFLRQWINLELTPNIVGEPDFVVMRREVMRRAGPFLEDMPQFLDTQYWIRLLAITDWVNLTEKEYGVFRVHPNAASARNEATGQGLFDRLRCFEVLTTILSGGDRKLVIRARNHAIGKMVEKFFGRVQSGKKTSTNGSGSLMKFCLKHPFVIGCAILRYALREVKIALRPS